MADNPSIYGAGNYGDNFYGTDPRVALAGGFSFSVGFAASPNFGRGLVGNVPVTVSLAASGMVFPFVQLSGGFSLPVTLSASILVYRAIQMNANLNVGVSIKPVNISLIAKLVGSIDVAVSFDSNLISGPFWQDNVPGAAPWNDVVVASGVWANSPDPVSPWSEAPFVGGVWLPITPPNNPWG